MRFFKDTDPYDPVFNANSDALFQECIEVNVSWTFEKTLKVVVEKLLELGNIPGVREPSKEDFKKAVQMAKEYKPIVHKEMKTEGLGASSKNGSQSKNARYYGIAVEVDLSKLLETFFSSSSADRDLFDILRYEKRIERRPHVTIVHENELKSNDGNGKSDGEVEASKVLWGKCENLASRWGSQVVTVHLTLGPLLVWDMRTMSIQVSKITYAGAGLKQEDMPFDVRNKSHHITVGTVHSDVRPVEGKWLLESAVKGEETSRAGDQIQVATLDTIEVTGRVRRLL